MVLNESDINYINNVKETIPNKNINVNGMINDSYKHKVIFKLTKSKQQVILELNQCNYKTSPIIIAKYLEDFFKEWTSQKGHWLFISQHYTPRAINRTINRLVKLQTTGKKTICNPSAYFTSLIKFRKKRKS